MRHDVYVNIMPVGSRRVKGPARVTLDACGAALRLPPPAADVLTDPLGVVVELMTASSQPWTLQWSQGW
jgi:hypothetical protein